mmetsp:Transcript_110126/g.307888  ORF Transcript_110126/g.307888 Transcript_110126/m.307888 type:complete len:315 (-) Transcript_110126:136-1080(-)
MWFIFDCLGITLGLLTWALLAFADWVVVRHILASWFWTATPRVSVLPLTDVGTILFIWYQMILGLSWFSHLQAMTTDPGTIRQSDAPAGFVNSRVCTLCKGRWKPPRAHHCKMCKRCIFRMDHHCPWINNCVGLGNQKLFILFLGYTTLCAAVTFFMLLGSAGVWLWSQNNWSDAPPPSSMTLICTGVLALVCIAAVIFIGDFLQEQIESIATNCTLVETYQHTHGERTSFMDHFRTVFGEHWFVWPWPFPTAPPPNYFEEAIPDRDGYAWGNADFDDTDNLGIAGEATEASVTEIPDSDAREGSEGNRPRQRH